MKHPRTILAIALALAVTPFWGASAAPDRQGDLTPGTNYTWEGASGAGLNVNYHDNVGLVNQTDIKELAPADDAVRTVAPMGKCSKDSNTFCESTLLSFTNPVPAADADGKLTKAATIKLTNAKGDVDLMVYASDAQGTKGDLVGRSAGPLDTLDHTDLDETLVVSVVTTRPTVAKPTQPDEPVKWYLVEVVYYANAPGGYTGTVTF